MEKKLSYQKYLIAIHIVKWNTRFVWVKYTIARALSILDLAMFDISFLENAIEFNRGVT